MDQRLRKEQAGYRRGRGTTEQVFVLRNIVEQVNEWQATLYLGFIDFEKAFDSIHRDSLWIIMRKYGIPEKIVRMVKLFVGIVVLNRVGLGDEKNSWERRKWYQVEINI